MIDTPRAKRLLILCQGIDGGIAPLSSSLAYGLQKCGWSGSICYVGRPANSKFVSVDQERGIDSQAIVTGKARSLAEIAGLLVSIIPIIHTVRKNRPTTIIFAGFMCALLYPLILRPITSAEFVFWDHAPQNTFLNIKRLIFPLVLGSFKKIISISQSTASALTDYFGVSPEKITIIPNGLDPTRWQSLPPPTDLSILKIIMPARFDLNQKDPVTLVKAAAILHKKGIEIKVTFVGSGVDAEVLKNAIKVEDAANYIQIMPHSEDIPALVAKHNILCLSTRFEGLPTVVIEGMLAKRLVVASRVAGCIDIIKDGVTGIFFAPASAEDCASKLKSLMTMPNPQDIIDAAFTEATSLYSLQAMVQNFQRILTL